jgi:hypothetical protein
MDKSCFTILTGHAPSSFTNRDLFVIMPFSGTKSCTEDQWTEIFENVFSPAAQAAQLACSRVQIGTGSLIKSIVERLRTSYIVLADITDANPNVFYELGVRHSLSKRTIIVAQAASHIPSDLRGYWSLTYGTSPKQVIKFREELCRIVEEINSSPERSDNPVADFLEREFSQGSRQMNVDAARKLSALHTELTGAEIELSREQSNQGTNSITSHTCLSLLLDFRYLDPGAETLRLAYETRGQLRLLAAIGYERQLLIKAKASVSELKKRVDDVRQKINKGNYVEPEQLSVMEWSKTGSNVEPGVDIRSWTLMSCATSAISEDVDKLKSEDRGYQNRKDIL